MSRAIDYKIRIRDALRRRLETAAKKRDHSINAEMVARIEESFERGDLLKLEKITAGLETAYGRFARELRDRQQTQELMNAAEALVRQVQDREELKPTITWVQEAIAAIAKVHGRTYDLEPWEK
jgi:predicted transcriptional regulator